LTTKVKLDGACAPRAQAGARTKKRLIGKTDKPFQLHNTLQSSSKPRQSQQKTTHSSGQHLAHYISVNQINKTENPNL
jgi:hypothetical protein